MTSSGGGSPSPQDEPHSLSTLSTMSPSSSQSNIRRRPSALERRNSNVIDVQDPARVLECSQLERQRKFQYLVRRYLSQILYGCKSAYCDTPTCLSRNKRGAMKPYRPPTQLTARALAHYLASQSNPHRGLCPHELIVAPSALGIEPDVDSSPEIGSDDRKNQSQRTARMKTHALTSIIDRSHQVKKDTKSIGQNLYDSVSVIYSYSKSIPSSLWAFDALSAPAIEGQPDKRLDLANESVVTAQTATPTRQHARQDLQVQGQAHETRGQSTVLSNGQLVHRVPYHPPPVSDQMGPTTNSNTSVDSTRDISKMSIRKTGRKSFTLGASIPSITKPNVAGARAPRQEVRKPDISHKGSIQSASHLSCGILDDLKDAHHRRHEQKPADVIAGDKFTSRWSRSDEAFVKRSLFYTLGDAEALLLSFQDPNDAFRSSPLSHLDSARLAHSFRDWSQDTSALIFNSLSVALEALLVPPPALDQQGVNEFSSTPDSLPKVGSISTSESKFRPRYLNNYESAHIVMICIHALTSSVPVAWPRTWAQLRDLRSWGVIVPSVTADLDNFADPFVKIIDAFEYEPAARLAKRLLRMIGVRSCFDHMLAARKSEMEAGGADEIPRFESLSSLLTRHLVVVEQAALETKRKMKSINTINKEPGWTVTATLVEWVKTTIIKNWDGKMEVNKWNSVGAAIVLLRQLHEHQRQLNLWSRMFRLPYLHEHTDTLHDPIRFLCWKSQPNILHLFQYAELHPTDYLVKFFRVINLTSMMNQYDHTQHTQQMLRQLDTFLREPYLYMIKHRLKVTLNDYLVLDVSREQPLKDTLDQLWRQERKTLLKPLKVKLGQQEGEVGLDHGGVTYEFFRVAIGEAFAPDYGMFTIDPRTQMTWFQPGSLEPLWKFKMLGVLFSLAIYNGITLPVTFPLAFYNLMLNSRFKFLDDHTSIDYIRDGWPDLAKSFEALLNWEDGDVADVFVRDYAFSYEAFGQKIDLDMTKHDDKSSSSSETPLVNNENRGMFVRDYVTYLILRSIRPQLKAFKKGFNTCLDPRSLELFTPKTLKQLVEGTQTISISELRACATYEDYDATHPAVRMFWDIVQDFSQKDAAHLLEFVTASDRVPVTGYKGLTFNIVRMGSDSEQLPTSSTCFGKLYLPEYKDKEKMTRKLELAIQNAKGFGVV